MRFGHLFVAMIFSTLAAAAAAASVQAATSTSTTALRPDLELVQATLIQLLEGDPIAVEAVKFAKHKGDDITTGTILFQPAPLDRPIYSASILLNDFKEYSNLTAADKAGIQSAALDLERRTAAVDFERRALVPDGYTTPSAAQLDRRIKIYTPPPAPPKYFWDHPQVFFVSPPGYSADGQYAVVHTAATWSGHMHGCYFVTYFALRDGKWKLLSRASVYYV